MKIEDLLEIFKESSEHVAHDSSELDFPINNPAHEVAGFL